jgi:hypothetical protein
MTKVRRWLTRELEYRMYTEATLRACIQALHPTRNPRLKAALAAIEKPKRKRKREAKAAATPRARG